MCVQGRGWEPGQLRAKLQELIEKHSEVPKAAAYTHSGPQIGETKVNPAEHVLEV